MVDPTFSLVGLAILPAFFFYVSFNLPPVVWFFRILLNSMAMFAAMIFVNTLVISNASYSDASGYLLGGLIALWLFYLLMELFMWLVLGLGILKDAVKR